MLVARVGHTATLLPDGRVLVGAGGCTRGLGGCADGLDSAELYDPSGGTWTVAASLANSRYDHAATLLLDGSVLVVGGDGAGGTLASAELFDPRGGS